MLLKGIAMGAHCDVSMRLPFEALLGKLSMDLVDLVLLRLQ